MSSTQPNFFVAMKLQDATDIVVRWARNERLVRTAYIFGSRARNTHRPDSDLDVAIQVNVQPGDGSEYACWAFESDGLTARLQKLLPVMLHLEWYDPIQTPHVHLGIIESSIKVYDQFAT